MAEPFIGQIIMFGGNFAPKGWALCDGELLSISQHDALFSILGTTYGGDGRTTFGLPDLRGRAAMHYGSGPGLSTYKLGQKGGVETVTLGVDEIPSHSHTRMATSSAADTGDPSNAIITRKTAAPNVFVNNATLDATMSADSIGATGGNTAHDNMQPYECVNFIIALIGIYPSRN